MRDLNERTVGWGLGLVGGLLFGVGGLLALALGTFNLAIGHSLAGIGDFGAAIAMLVVGGLALLFTYLANGAWKGYALTPAIGLLLVGAVGGLWLGTVSILGLLGGLFVFLAGLLYLIPPAIVGVKSIATA
jgi:hypothetical protein